MANVVVIVDDDYVRTEMQFRKFLFVFPLFAEC